MILAPDGRTADALAAWRLTAARLTGAKKRQPAAPGLVKRDGPGARGRRRIVTCPVAGDLSSRLGQLRPHPGAL
jgi:hypothetical protein